ncbi:MAG: hypothetical protein OWS74_07665 [Firmicutes bacterium]|nr:hypothetical protein [Bacillota bacterium]
MLHINFRQQEIICPHCWDRSIKRLTKTISAVPLYRLCPACIQQEKIERRLYGEKFYVHLSRKRWRYVQKIICPSCRREEVERFLHPPAQPVRHELCLTCAIQPWIF